MRSENKVFVNVASSHYCVEDFINYDNHIFLLFINFPFLFKIFFPNKYHDFFNKYVVANENFKLIRWNCKKDLPHDDESIDHILCSNFLEHVHEDEALLIVRGFYKKLKKGGTLHILLPDLSYFINQYNNELKGEEPEKAADWLNFGTLLTTKKMPTIKFRLMEFIGVYGLKHYRMYDKASAHFLFKKCGFKENSSPNLCKSYSYGLNNGDLHLFYVKD